MAFLWLHLAENGTHHEYRFTPVSHGPYSYGLIVVQNDLQGLVLVDHGLQCLGVANALCLVVGTGASIAMVCNSSK